MNKKWSFTISLVLLIMLIAAYTFRYSEIENTNELNRYVDRWTQVEWVEVTLSKQLPFIREEVVKWQIKAC